MYPICNADVVPAGLDPFNWCYRPEVRSGLFCTATDTAQQPGPTLGYTYIV